MKLIVIIYSHIFEKINNSYRGQVFGMSIEKLNQIWPEWKMESLLGEGSFGKVYKAVREERGMTTYSAIKVVSIPKSDSELAALRTEGWSEGATKTYLQGIVDDFVNEIKMMEAMKGTPNIVSVEDYKVIEKTDKVGWDIFIRMELLTSFNDFISNRILPEEKVIILGEHILKALDLCAQRNIIHRDIKPENIFISSFGYYKLGDFGIARELEKTSGSMTQIGTYNYVAPEVAASRHYDATVDTYSLGIVLYRLLNNNRLPFIDPQAQLVQYQDRKNAIDRRLSGEPLPIPINASQSMAQVILKACAFNPKDRYQTPVEFWSALETVRTGGKIPDFVPTELLSASGTVSLRTAPQAKHERHGQNKADKPTGNKKTPKKFLVIAISVLLIAALGTGGYFFLSNKASENYANQVVEALQSGDYSEAVAVFNDKIDDKNMGTLEDNLLKRLDDLKNGYKSETIDYSVAIMEINTIRKFRISSLSGKINSVEQYIESINTSRTAFNTAQTLFDSGDYAEAINQYKQVIGEDPNYEQAKDGVKNATDQYRQTSLASAKEYADKSDYDQAIFILNSSLDVIPNDSEITQQINIYKAKQETYNKQQQNVRRQNAMDDAAGYASDKDWDRAIATLNTALEELPNDNALMERLETYKTQQQNAKRQAAINTANGYADEKDWINAIATIDSALEELPNDPALIEKLSDHKAAYEDYTISAANSLVAQKKYDEAAALVNKALADLSGNVTLQEMLRKIDDSRPVSLFTLTPLNGGWESSKDVLEDSLGRTYSVTLPYAVTGNAFGEYYTNGKYSAIRGRIVPYKGFYENSKTQFRVYADDVLIYASADVGQKTLEFEFDVNISGTEYIKVEVIRTAGGYNNNKILVMDMVLDK